MFYKELQNEVYNNNVIKDQFFQHEQTNEQSKIFSDNLGNFVYYSKQKKYFCIWDGWIYEVDKKLNILNKKRADFGMFEGRRAFSRVIGWAATFNRVTNFGGRFLLLDVDQHNEVALKEFLPESLEIRTLITIPNFELKVFDLHGKLFIYDTSLYLSTGQKVYEVCFDISEKDVQILQNDFKHDEDINNLTKHIQKNTHREVIYDKNKNVALISTTMLKPADYYNFMYQHEVFTYTIFFGQKISIILPRHGRDQFFIKLAPDQMFLTYFDHKLLIISNYNQTKFRVINLPQRKYIDVNNVHYDMDFVIKFRQGSIRNLLEISANNHLTLQQSFMEKFKEIREAGSNLSFFGSHALEFQKQIAAHIGQSILTRSNTEIDLVQKIQNKSTLLLQDLYKDDKQFNKQDMSQLQSVSTIFGKENEVFEIDSAENSKIESQNKSNIQQFSKKNVMAQQYNIQDSQIAQIENNALSKVELQLQRLTQLVEQLIESQAQNKQQESQTKQQHLPENDNVVDTVTQYKSVQRLEPLQAENNPLTDTSDIQFVLSQEFDTQQQGQNINQIHRSSTGIIYQDIEVNFSNSYQNSPGQQTNRENEEKQDIQKNDNKYIQNTAVQEHENQSDRDIAQQNSNIQLQSVDSLTTDTDKSSEGMYALSSNPETKAQSEKNNTNLENQEDINNRITTIEDRLDQQGKQLNTMQDQIQTILSLLTEQKTKQTFQ